MFHHFPGSARCALLLAGVSVALLGGCLPPTTASPNKGPVAPPTAVASRLAEASPSGQHGASLSASPSTTPQPTAVQSAEPATVTMREAWGSITVRSFSTAIGNDRFFNWQHAATPDGLWLVGTNVPRKFLGTTQASYAVLRNVETGQLRMMATLATPQSQILEASADDRWVVWSEADGPDFFDWRIEAFDRTTNTVHEVAHAVQADGAAVPGPEAWPVVSGDRVIWSQAMAAMQPGGSTIGNAAVRLANLTTGAITTITTGATAPALAWPWATWQTGNATQLWIESRNLVTGQDSKTPGAFAELSMAGRSIVYNDPDSLSLFLVSDVAADSKPVVLLTSTDVTDHLQWPTLNDRLVAWAQDSTTQVFDRAQRRFVTLPVTGLSAAFVAGPLLVWSSAIAGQSPAPATEAIEQLNFIDVRSLPTGP